MPNLTWTEGCRIGIDSLDYEHQDLFERINELHAALARHDSHGFFAGLGDLVRTGPTDTNVCDLAFLIHG